MNKLKCSFQACSIVTRSSDIHLFRSGKTGPSWLSQRLLGLLLVLTSASLVTIPQTIAGHNLGSSPLLVSKWRIVPLVNSKLTYQSCWGDRYWRQYVISVFSKVTLWDDMRCTFIMYLKNQRYTPPIRLKNAFKTMDTHKPVTFPWRIALTELRFYYVSVVVPQEGQAWFHILQ